MEYGIHWLRYKSLNVVVMTVTAILHRRILLAIPMTMGIYFMAVTNLSINWPPSCCTKSSSNPKIASTPEYSQPRIFRSQIRQDG